MSERTPEPWEIAAAPELLECLRDLMDLVNALPHQQEAYSAKLRAKTIIVKCDKVNKR